MKKIRQLSFSILTRVQQLSGHFYKNLEGCELNTCSDLAPVPSVHLGLRMLLIAEGGTEC